MTGSDSRFTIVFEGDIRNLDFNPMDAESCFGKVAAAGRGDAFEELDVALSAIAGKITAE